MKPSGIGSLYRLLCALCLLTIAAVFVLLRYSCAEEVRFGLSCVPPVMLVGEPGELQLAFDGTASVPPLELPEIDGLQLRYLGPATSMTVVNGVMSASIVHMYSVVPLRTGSFMIGPLKFEFEGKTYVSNQLKLEAGNPAAAAASAAAASAQPAAAGVMDLRERIKLVVEVARERVYVNELVSVRLKVLVNGLNVRDVQYPVVQHEGLSLEPWGQHRQYRQVIAGTAYDVIEFPAVFFPLKPGERSFGPSKVQCTLLARRQGRSPAQQSAADFFGSDFFADFFGGYEAIPVSVSAKPVPISVSALPEEGRPADFGGALGEFSLDVSAGPLEVKAGDPVTLKMAVRGEGNFKTVGAPRLESMQGFKAYDPQVKEEDGVKYFEQILMPLDGSVSRIPAVTFSFFSPAAGAYRTLKHDPIALKVTPPDREEKQLIVEQASARAPERRETLGSDIGYIRESSGRLSRPAPFLYQRSGYRWLHLFVVLAFLAAAGVRAWLRRLETDVRYARKLKAPGTASAGLRLARSMLRKRDAAGFYDGVHRTLQGYFGHRLHLSSRAITLATVEEALEGASVDAGIIAKLRGLFEACDAARYAPAAFAEPDLARSLYDLETVINYFQRTKV